MQISTAIILSSAVNFVALKFTVKFKANIFQRNFLKIISTKEIQQVKCEQSNIFLSVYSEKTLFINRHEREFASRKILTENAYVCVNSCGDKCLS